MRFKSTLLLIIIISTALSLRITLYDSTFEDGQKTKNQCGLTTTTSTSTSTSSTSPLTTPTTTETTPKWTTTQALDETSTKSSISSNTKGEEKITDSSTTAAATKRTERSKGKSATSTETFLTSPNGGSKSTVSLTPDEGTQESFSSSTKPTKTVSKTTIKEIVNVDSTVSSRPSLQTTQKASETPTSPNDAIKTTDATIPSTTKSTPSDSTTKITKTSTETTHVDSTLSSMPSSQTTHKASEKTPATPKLTTTIALDTVKSSTKSSPTKTGKTFAPSTSSSSPTTATKISTAQTAQSSTSVTTAVAQSSSTLKTSGATKTSHSTTPTKQSSLKMPSSAKVETPTTTANKSDSTSLSSPTSVQTTTTKPTPSSTLKSIELKTSITPSSKVPTTSTSFKALSTLITPPSTSVTVKTPTTSASSTDGTKFSITTATIFKTTTTRSSVTMPTTTIIESKVPTLSSSKDISTSSSLFDTSTTKIFDETSMPSELSEKTTKPENTVSSPSTSTKIDYLANTTTTESDGPKITVTSKIPKKDDISTTVEASSTVDKYSDTTLQKTEGPTKNSTTTISSEISTLLQSKKVDTTEQSTQTPAVSISSKSEDSETTEMENYYTTTLMQSATDVSATLTSENEHVYSKTTSTSPQLNTIAVDDSTNTVSMTTTTVVQSNDATTFDKSTATTTVPQSASTSVFDYSTKSVPDHDTTEDTAYETTKSERSETLQPPTTTAVVDKYDDRTVSPSTNVRASNSDSSTKSLSVDDTTKDAILQTAESTENLQSPTTTVVDVTVSPSTSARATDLGSTSSLPNTPEKETITASEIMASSTSSDQFPQPQSTSQATTSTTTGTTFTPTTGSPEDTKPFLFCGLKPCASEFGYDGKVSFGYHDRIAIISSKNEVFKSLKFKRIFSNGTEESEFTSVKNSTLNGNVWSIPVTDVLKNKFARNSINSFILNVEIQDSNKAIRSWNYTLKNNQSPIPGGCSVSPSSFPAMTNVTFSCNGWSDSDGIKSYTFYKSIPSEKTKLISFGTSPNSTASYTLSEGTYNIYATATDTLSATSDKIFIQQITVTPAKVYQYLNNNETKTLSEIDAILDAFLKGTLVTDLVDDANILSAKENLPKSVANFLDWALQNRNATPDQIENAIKTAFGNELSEYTNGLSPEAILALINKKLNQINDKKADVFGELLTDISKIPIRSTSDLVQVLQSTSSALRKSLSFTIDGTTFSDGIVLYARIHNSATNLILVNGYISAKNNIVYLEGDFRVAKFMQNNGIDSFDLKAGYKKMSADIYLYENDTSIMIASGQTQVFPVSSKHGLSFFGETTVSVDSKIYRQHLITAWKISFDQSLPTYNTDQAIPNSTFTTFLPLSVYQGSSYLSFPTLTTSSIKAFMTGESLEIGESKLSFDILTKNSKTISTNMELKSGKLLFKKSNDKIISLWIAEFEWINVDSLKTATGYNWKGFIPETLKLENISSNFIQKLVPGSNMQVLIEGVNQLPAILITGFEGEEELEIADALEWLLSSSLEISGKWKTINEFKQTFRNGVRVNVSDGVLNFEGGSQIEFFDGFLQYSGSSLFYQPTISDTVKQLYNVKWDVVLNDGIIIFEIENGMSNKETNTQHFETIITLKDGAEIQLSGGILSRNSSYGYVISNAEISANKYQMCETGLKPQSLMNFEVQNALIRIMGNVTNALKNNGSDLSDEELASVESNVMQIAEDVSKSIEAAFQNPLDSILAKSLAYEKNNYDDIFNWLPLNPADIRYIEDFSNEEEWAEQAAAIRQVAYAKRSIYSMNAMISALEDVQVQKLLASGKTSGSISYSAGGTSMQVDIGKMSDLLSKIHSCNDWTIQLPTKLSDLNNPQLNESEIYRLSLICQETNVYMYTDNAYALITSGYVNSTFKTVEGKIIEIENTKAPIIITGNNKAAEISPTKINYKDFGDHEVLDIHTFSTEQWNGTMILQIQVLPNDDGEMPSEDDVADGVFFSSFQFLPGPLRYEHDFNFTVKPNEVKYVFYDQETMLNRTGRYYIGLGNRNCILDDNNNTVSYENVTALKIPSNSKCYKRELPFKYSIKAVTKAGFYLNEKKDRFENFGIVTKQLIGDDLTQFHTNHMSVFSVGKFAPEIPSRFGYKYVPLVHKRDTTILIIFACILIFTFYLLFESKESEIDHSWGFIINNSDNLSNHSYQYIVMVETGYKLFAATESGISIKLFGTEDTTELRKLDGDYTMIKMEKYGFKRCHRERFLVTTDKPLGEIRYLQVGTDLKGKENLQSWFCDQIEVLDLQTDKLYSFRIKQWFDRVEDKFFEPMQNWNLFKEAGRIQNLVENLFFALPCGAGFGRFRTRYSRAFMAFEYGRYLFLLVGFACFFAKMILNQQTKEAWKMKVFEFGNETNLNNARDEFVFQLGDYEVSFLDIGYGCLAGFLITIYLIPLFAMARACPSTEEFDDYNWINRFQKKFYNKGSYILWHAIFYVHFFIDLAVCFFFYRYALKVGAAGMAPEVNLATKIFFLAFIFHIIFEISKSYLINIWLLYFRKDYYIISAYEKYCLNPLPLEAFAHVRYENPPEVPDLSNEVAATKVKRKRVLAEDEKLLRTLKEAIPFIAEIIICTAMLLYSRDSSIKQYKDGLHVLFNAQKGYENKGSPMPFWNITTKDNFWKWAQTDLVDGILVSYPDRPAFNKRGYFNDKSSRSIGIGIIRQIRVSNVYKGCERYIKGTSKSVYVECGIDYAAPEDTISAYSVGWKNISHPSQTEYPYIYRSEEELNGLPYHGRYGIYSAGGYTALLNGSKTDIRNQLIKLQAQNWIDHRTQAVMVELAAYNAPYNYFGVIKLVIERNPKKFIFTPMARVQPVRLFKYIGEDGNAVYTFETLYCCVAAFLLIKEILSILYHRFRNLMTIWTILNIFITTLCTLSVVYYFLRLKLITEISEEFVETNGNIFINFDKVTNYELTFINYLSASVGLICFRILDIMRFNFRVEAVLVAIKNARKRMAGWFVLFIGFLCAFSLPVYLMTRGTDEEKRFESFGMIVEAAIISMLGQITWLDRDVVGDFMYFFWYEFIVLGIFGMLNVLTLIVQMEYIAVRRMNYLVSEYNILEHLRYKFKKFFGFLGPDDRPRIGFPNDRFHSPEAEQMQQLVNEIDARLDKLIKNRYRNVPNIHPRHVIQ